MKVKHLESRPHRKICHDDGDESTKESMDYFIEFDSQSSETSSELIEGLKHFSSHMRLPSAEPDDQHPWFPKHISELKRCCTALFKYGSELATDHPGYGDEHYVQRRRTIADVSKNYE